MLKTTLLSKDFMDATAVQQDIYERQVRSVNRRLPFTGLDIPITGGGCIQLCMELDRRLERAEREQRYNPIMPPYITSYLDDGKPKKAPHYVDNVSITEEQKILLANVNR